MICKLCQKEILNKFYLHLNSSHKSNKKKYLAQFPEQKEDYEKQISVSWNKGLTAKDHPSIASGAEKTKKYANLPEVKKKRSDDLKFRYIEAGGDIVSPEIRAKIVKIGSNAWVNKIKNVSEAERKELLENFTTAGNKAQAEKRHLLTPDDYNRLYPFAKGTAGYCNCENCDKKIIAWFGGKPRPKKRFCNSICYNEYLEKHPGYCLSDKGCLLYHSKKMNIEFALRSKLEFLFADLLDAEESVTTWYVSPFYINYEYLGKNHKYFPDFFVNNKFVIELKSDYVYKRYKEVVTEKIKSAEEFCKKNGYEYNYWQFNGPFKYGRDKKLNLDLCKDERIMFFLERIKNG